MPTCSIGHYNVWSPGCWKLSSLHFCASSLCFCLVVAGNQKSRSFQHGSFRFSTVLKYDRSLKGNHGIQQIQLQRILLEDQEKVNPRTNLYYILSFCFFQSLPLTANHIANTFLLFWCFWWWGDIYLHLSCNRLAMFDRSKNVRICQPIGTRLKFFFMRFLCQSVMCPDSYVNVSMSWSTVAPERHLSACYIHPGGHQGKLCVLQV